MFTIFDSRNGKRVTMGMWLTRAGAEISLSRTREYIARGDRQDLSDSIQYFYVGNI